MSEPKDCWDKAEVVSKVAIPVLVALVAWHWNVQNTARQTAATMTEIAVGILSIEPEENSSNPLREWAISVLQNPSNPPALTERAANQLRLEAISVEFGRTLAEIMNRQSD